MLSQVLFSVTYQGTTAHFYTYFFFFFLYVPQHVTTGNGQTSCWYSQQGQEQSSLCRISLVKGVAMLGKCHVWCYHCAVTILLLNKADLILYILRTHIQSDLPTTSKAFVYFLCSHAAQFSDDCLKNSKEVQNKFHIRSTTLAWTHLW